MCATCSTDYRLKPHDLCFAGLSLLFAAFSLLWPDSGESPLAGLGIARGYAMAVAYLGLAALCLLMPLLVPAAARIGAAWTRGERRPRGTLATAASFVRSYYSELFISLFFTDAILLSARAFGGAPHDAFFAACDQAIFGCQPARELEAALGSRPWVNELMFGSYFAYFAFMAATVWIPFFKGEREEGFRQIFVVAALTALTCVWYVFFRVEGPKYWLADLRASGYGSFEGGPFVGLFQRTLAHATLSGAAFPSTHVILTLTTLGLAWRNDKRYFAVYLPFGCAILLATVYIRAHWATDVLGGALVATLVSPVLYRSYGAADAFAKLASTKAGGALGWIRSRAPRRA
jgi:PAP2 superfamily.